MHDFSNKITGEFEREKNEQKRLPFADKKSEEMNQVLEVFERDTR